MVKTNKVTNLNIAKNKAKENSKVRVFLDVNPISPYKGKLLRSTYEPELSPEEVLSYKLVSSFKGNKKTPKLSPAPLLSEVIIKQ